MWWVWMWFAMYLHWNLTSQSHRIVMEPIHEWHCTQVCITCRVTRTMWTVSLTTTQPNFCILKIAVAYRSVWTSPNCEWNKNLNLLYSHRVTFKLQPITTYMTLWAQFPFYGWTTMMNSTRLWLTLLKHDSQLFRRDLLPPANEVWDKVIFFHLSVILFTGGVCLSACWNSRPPRPDTPSRTRHPWEQTTPGARHFPGPDTPHPWTRHPPAQCMLGDTGNKRAVRILLECNLVLFIISGSCLLHSMDQKRFTSVTSPRWRKSTGFWLITYNSEVNRGSGFYSH